MKHVHVSVFPKDSSFWSCKGHNLNYFFLFPTVSVCFLHIIQNVIPDCRTYFIWHSGYFSLYVPLKLHYLFLFCIVLTLSQLRCLVGIYFLNSYFWSDNTYALTLHKTCFLRTYINVARPFRFFFSLILLSYSSYSVLTKLIFLILEYMFFIHSIFHICIGDVHLFFTAHGITNLVIFPSGTWLTHPWVCLTLSSLCRRSNLRYWLLWGQTWWLAQYESRCGPVFCATYKHITQTTTQSISF